MEIVSCAMPLPQSEWNGRVHSVFENCINIVLESGELLTIHGYKDVILPMSVFVPEFNSRSMKVGDLVCDSGDSLYVGSIKISRAENQKIFFLQMKSRNSMLACNKLMEVYTVNRKKQVNSINEPVFSYLEQLGTQLAQVLENDDSVQINELVKKMIGCGYGLTPSGDDMLVGMLAWYRSIDIQKYDRLRKEIKEERFRTTDVGKKYLECACLGHFSSAVLSLFNSKNEEEELYSSKKMVEFGHTSGTDLLCGILCAAQKINCIYIH